MSYFDGFVIPVPNARKDDFIRHASLIDPIFLEKGAIRVAECWGDDVPAGERTDFARSVALEADETVAFSWIEWPDKATRNAAFATMMDPENLDPRADPAKNPMPFDGKRMIYGGFEPVFSAGTLSPDAYVEGFVVAVPETAKAAYAEAARVGWETIFEPAGATGHLEAWAEDVPTGEHTDFARSVALEAGEVVVFSFVAWPSRAARDAIQQKMRDEPEAFEMPDCPFDASRMIYGGFVPVVALETEHA